MEESHSRRGMKWIFFYAKKVILEEARSGSFSMHPGRTKMYQDLKVSYRWSRMKRDVSEFVTKCMVCQKVKAEHQVPLGLL